MVTFRPALRARGRALLSGAAAVLLLLRALVLLADAPAAFAAGLGEPAATVLCAGAGDDAPGGHHAPGDRHCPVCLFGDRHRPLDSALPIASSPLETGRASSVSAIVPLPRAGPGPRACGWIGSWSSRAPPRG
ncbi:MAG TPA: hypothetical protein VIG55_08725 [Methylosinus sp.]|jgi:hypothetical protein